MIPHVQRAVSLMRSSEDNPSLPMTKSSHSYKLFPWCDPRNAIPLVPTNCFLDGILETQRFVSLKRSSRRDLGTQLSFYWTQSSKCDSLRPNELFFPNTILKTPSLAYQRFPWRDLPERRDFLDICLYLMEFVQMKSKVRDKSSSFWWCKRYSEIWFDSR